MRRDPQENAQALYQIAASQGGYFTAAQARAAGYTYRQQHYHCSRGNWLRIDRGLFRLRDFPPGEREDLIRWSLWSRDQKGMPQAVVSHDTALTVHDLSDVMPERVHLTVPRGFRKRVPAGCILHFGSLAEEEVESRPGYSVTTPLGSVLSRPYLCHLQNNTSRTFLVNILFYRPECLFLHTHTLIPKIHHYLIICIAYGGFKAPTGIVLCLSFFHASPFTQKGQLQTTVCKLPSRCYNDCSFFLCFGTLFLCLCSASLVKAYIFLLCSITSADASSVTTFA